MLRESHELAPGRCAAGGLSGVLNQRGRGHRGALLSSGSAGPIDEGATQGL